MFRSFWIKDLLMNASALRKSLRLRKKKPQKIKNLTFTQKNAKILQKKKKPNSAQKAENPQSDLTFQKHKRLFTSLQFLNLTIWSKENSTLTQTSSGIS